MNKYICAILISGHMTVSPSAVKGLFETMLTQRIGHQKRRGESKSTERGNRRDRVIALSERVIEEISEV